MGNEVPAEDGYRCRPPGLADERGAPSWSSSGEPEPVPKLVEAGAEQVPQGLGARRGSVLRCSRRETILPLLVYQQADGVF